MQTTLMLEDRPYVTRCCLPTTFGNSNNAYVTRSRLATQIISNGAYVTASRLSQAYVTKNIEIQTTLMLQGRVYENTYEVETTLML